MKVAFLIQNLSHATDSVGYDCIFQYNIIHEYLGEAADIRIFADVFKPGLHPNVTIHPFAEFWEFRKANPDAKIIYHFCDGWDGVDEFLAQQGENCFIRWHNITPPWFYTFQSVDFASSCLRGYSIISKIAYDRSANFLVNSEFSRQQLEALHGLPARIHTVFPGSVMIGKCRLSGGPGPQAMAASQPLDLLFVGRVVPHKGHKHIISVAHAVQTFLGRPVRVIFVGSLEPRLKSYWTELQEIANQLAVEVVFTDVVSDDALIEIYKKAHVFVCMSEHEGFGMPVFEAMRSKVPVVCWTSSAFFELLKSHPLASPVFNVAWFAAAVCATLDPTIRAHVLGHQESYLNAYNRDVIAAQLLRAVFGVTEMRPAGAESHAAWAKLNDKLRAGWQDAGERLGIVESRNSKIDRYVSNLAEKIQVSLGSAIKIFPHDAFANYVSLYDIPVYQKVLDALRQEKWRQDIGFVLDAAIDPHALHPHADIIAHLSSGHSPMSLAPIDRLEALLSFDDDVFVRLAYRTLLDRAPAPGACLHYLGKLRRGVRKEEILAELAALPEARSLGRRLTGFAAEALLAAPPDPKPRRSFFNWLHRRKTVPAAAPPSPAEALRLERLEEGVNRLARFLMPTLGTIASNHPMGSVHHVDDLLRLNEQPFVELSFQVILGRAGDPGGIEYYLNALRGGMKPKDFLVELARSDEGRPRVGLLGGLQDLVAAADAGIPHDAPPHDGTPARIGRIENDLGRLIQKIVARQVIGPRAEPRAEDAAGSVLRRSLGQGISIPSAAPKALLSAASEHVAPPAQAIRLLHQILITQEGTVPDTLPPLVGVNAESLRAHHPGATYKLWGLDKIRRFIAQHFEREVLDAFDTLKAFALKADLARYCILYVEGGLYSDLSNRFLNPLRLAPGRKLACFREHKPMHGALWLTQNTIIYAEPGQPEIRLAIDLVLANVRNRDYGVSSLAPSGPVLFGRVFAAVDRPALYQIGQAVNLQVDGGLNRACYVAPDGTLIAVRLQGGGGRPNELGLKGTNVYGLMWERREIYGENRLYFPYDHPAIGAPSKTEGAAIPIREADTGHRVYGPCTDLPPGKYVATMRFEEARGEGKLVLDVCGRAGSVIFAQRNTLTPDSEGQVSIPFALDEYEFEIEVRVHSMGGFSGLFRELTIVRADLAPTEAGPPPSAFQAPTLDPQPDAGEPITYLHQIFDLAATEPDAEIAADLRRDVALARDLHPLADYRAWDDISLRGFIAANFTADVVAAYDRLVPFACRADLARYCLLYALGGIVADPGIRFVNPLNIPKGSAIAAFRSARPDGGAPWAVDIGLLYAAPGQAEVKEAIEAIVSHVRAAEYGASAESVTGGHLFGRILAVAYDARRYVSGETVELTAGYPVENVCYLGGDGRLVGVRLATNRPHGYDWTLRRAQEAAGLWRSRKAYDLALVREFSDQPAQAADTLIPAL
jgi:glycosyltransferase involved in cell wall biosynthesis